MSYLICSLFDLSCCAGMIRLRQRFYIRGIKAVKFARQENFLYRDLCKVGLRSRLMHAHMPAKSSECPPDCDQFDAALHLIKKDSRPDRLILILDSTRNLDLALKIFKWASGAFPYFQTAAVYCHIVFKLGLSGNVQEMEVLLGEMMKLPNLNKEEVSSAFTFLIESFCQNGRGSEALKVFEVMNLSKSYSSVWACHILLAELVSRKDIQSVLFVYKEIVKVGIIPNAEMVNYLIEVLCETDRFDFALDQFHKMRKKGTIPTSRTYAVIVSELCLRHRIGDMAKILDDMFNLYHTVDTHFYDRVIPLLCKINRFKEAIKLYGWMVATNVLPSWDVADALIQSCSENLWLDDSIKLLFELTNMGFCPGVQTCESIVSNFCKLGKFGEADMFLDANVLFDTKPFNALLEGYCVTGRFTEANFLLSKMLAMDLCDNLSWNILIRGLCEKNCAAKAFQALGKMVVSSYVPDSDTYSAAIYGFCKLMQCECALDLFCKVRGSNWCLDLSSYVELIDMLCHANKFEVAVDVFLYMSNMGFSLSTCSFDLLIGGLCLTGKVELAIRLRTFASYRGTSSGLTAYNIIILELCKLGKQKNLLVLLAQIVVEGLTLTSESYCAIINALCGYSRIKDASFLFDRMVTEGLVPDSETLDTFVSCMIASSHLYMVVDSLDNIMYEERALKYDIYNKVILGLWNEGYRHYAHKFLGKMLEMGWIPAADIHAALFENTESEGSFMVDAGDCDKISCILSEGLETT